MLNPPEWSALLWPLMSWGVRMGFKHEWPVELGSRPGKLQIQMVASRRKTNFSRKPANSRWLRGPLFGTDRLGLRRSDA
jgi:hypothetical protein